MSRIKKTYFFLSIIASALYAGLAFAQSAQPRKQPPPPQSLPRQLWPPHPEAKMEARMNIDAKRQIENIESDDALPRSREFIRTDSTYYVGWMYEGVYKYNHAADYLGYKNAIVPLERTIRLMEHDYATALATRTDNILTYYPIRFIMPDYAMTAYYLVQCYSNTDQPDKIYALMRRAIKWKFQMQYALDPYNILAWTVHRNRFYTSAKYSFLKNSIDENERLANRYLDSGMRTIIKNEAINAPIAQYFHDYEEREKMSVYHYKNILYSYSFNIDSAEYYFDLMRKGGRLPHNNYANFKGICGDFRTAESEYHIASMVDGNDKRLQEWAYYSSILDIYKGLPKDGIQLSRDMIKSAGSTPGYGWYNIALARCLLYDGQVSEADRYANKAADWKELHIGTTLGQSQYDFSIQLIKLIDKEQSWQMDRFEHANWWYNPSVLASMAKKLSDKYLQQFLIINQFAQNPERDRVIYKLFSTESTVSWDEIWYLVHDFSTNFFISRFQKEAETDKRAYIRKYFELFVDRLEMQQGKYKEVKPKLDKLLHDPNMDEDYEKLFIARVFQAEAECAGELNNDQEKKEWLYKLYVIYPQLAPYTGLKMNMGIQFSGNVDNAVEQRLRACNINWVSNSDGQAPHCYVQFANNGTKKDITYYVLDNRGNYIVPKQSFAWQKPDDAAVSLAYRLFNIGGKEPEEKETPEKEKPSL